MGLGKAFQFQDKIGKEAQLDAGALQLGKLLGALQDIEHGGILLRGNLPHDFHRSRADAARRAVDDPSQAQIIGRRGNEAQIRQHVLDLGPVEEAGAADDAVGDAAALEGVFKLVGLGVHAVEHRMIPPVCPPPVGGQDLRGDILGLVPLVVGEVMGQQLSPVLVCPELFALALEVVGDDGVGRVQDMGGAAVILLESDDAAAPVLAFKAQDVFDRGAAEFVDGLVVVTHHADVSPAVRQKGGQAVLQTVGVLVLVDEDVAEAALPVLEHVGIFLQELDGVVNEIVKVHGVG